MDNKKIGVLLIAVGAVFAVTLSWIKVQLNHQADSLMALSGGSCFLESGKCIHQQSFLPFAIGIAAIVFIISLGIYLISFSKTTRLFERSQKTILNRLKTTKNKELKEEKFKILLQGLDEGEKKVLTAVKEQDGISQSTLRYRTDLSKTKLSMVLSQLEKKGLVAKVKKGKTNDIFLKKAI